LVKEIPLTQGKVALIDDEDYEKLKNYKFYAHTDCYNWYCECKIKRRQTKMHRLILNPKNNEQVDHINGNGLDNRRCNLRIATQSQNRANSKKQRNTPSKYKGAYWKEPNKKWQSMIQKNEKIYYLGLFEKEEDAAKAYDKAAKELFGEFARLNFKEASS
jgi:hypothetical protein